MQTGDRIAIMMPNQLQYIIAYYGSLKAGMIVVNTNPLYTPREMLHQFNDSGATAILILENYAKNLQEILPKTQIKHVMITTIGECMGWLKGSIVNFVVRKIRKMVPAYDLPTAIPYAKVMKEGKKFKLKLHKGKMDDTIVI